AVAKHAARRATHLLPRARRSRSQEALPALTASKTHSTHAQVSALRSPRSTSRLDRLANHWITIAPPARRISAPAWSRKRREMDQSQGAAKDSPADPVVMGARN